MLQVHYSFSHFPSSKSSRYATLDFSNPATPSRITTSKIPRSPEVRFLIVWSNLYYFFVHQPAAMNSIDYSYGSTHIPHSQHLQSDSHLQSSQRSLVEPFCRNSQHVKAVGCFRRGTLSLMFDRILSATLRWRFLPPELHRGILTPPSYFSWFTPNTNTIRCNLGLTPLFHFLEGVLIPWVAKAENLCLIVEQLPIKAECWYAPSHSRILAGAIYLTS